MNIQDHLCPVPFWIPGGEYQKVGDVMDVNQVIAGFAMTAFEEQGRSYENVKAP